MMDGLSPKEIDVQRQPSYVKWISSEFSQEVRQISDKDSITGSNPVTRTYCRNMIICKSGCHWDSKSTLILLKYEDWWRPQVEIKSSKSSYVNNSRDTMNSNPRGYIYEMKDMSYSVRFDDISQKSCVRWVHFRNRVCEQYCPTNINTHFRKVKFSAFK